jgi:hypothetical protein
MALSFYKMCCKAPWLSLIAWTGPGPKLYHLCMVAATCGPELLFIPIMWYFKMFWVVYFHIQIPGLHQARFIRPLKRVSLSVFLPQWTLMPGTCLRCIKYLGREIVDRAACYAEPNKVLFHSYDVSRNSYRSDIDKGSPMPCWSSTSVCLHEIWELLLHSGQLLLV